ncbi:sulfotransferase domain-containing protein [Myxococcus sp. CA051A]|uniref:sulfotransferase domain-containing protein n=2 Tax=Myxococcus TaxID=32 RepID=UPI00157B8409|nr:sulfotransferase domain-containing protein [Myxococcus sp. CA056]NTX50391.1 sulfotransferase domain-containing protein [Myxococcus sp. CA039A]NTX62792.1 sulfotransferase domain-containing protein [Myxococcus sp. CA051A]
MIVHSASFMSSPAHSVPRSRPWLRSLLRQSIIGLTWLSGRLLATAEWLRWVRLRYVWLKPRRGDIYIATSPKAGTTWMQMIVFQLVTQGRGEFEHINQVSPFLELLPRDATTEPLLDSLPSPRILKSHLPFQQLKPPRHSRIIYVTRNAADSLGSLYHHHCLMEATPLPFEGYFRVVMDVENPWLGHLESWWPHRKDANVLHVRYEDLIENLEAGVRRVAAFCELPIDESRLGNILERCGIAYMKQHNERFDMRGPQAALQGRGTFIHQGGVGQGRAKLSEEQRAELDTRVVRARQRLGMVATEP